MVRSVLALGLLVGFAFVIYGLIKDSQRTSGLDPAVVQAARGDRRLAQRLLENARQRYPGKSDRWYREKVIYDLERDGAGSGRGRSVSFDVGETTEKIWLATAFLSLINMFSYTLDNIFRRH